MDLSSGNFDAVRRVLKLKRYEMPPPRYFNEFSGQVISRIRAGAISAPRWWERFGFDLRPALTVGAGALCCALFLGTVAFGTDADAPSVPLAPDAAALVSAPQPEPSPSDAFVNAGGGGASSVSPVLNSSGAGRSAALELWRAQIRPASYTTAH